MGDNAEIREAPFGTTEETDVVGYQALSMAAVLAALLGVVSFTALLHPLLLCLPLAAVAVGIAAWRSIVHSRGALTGRRLALIGISLAVFFASAATARLLSRDYVLTARAQNCAADWLSVVLAGRREEAFEMAMPPARRRLPGTNLAEFYAGSAESNEELQHFFDDPVLRELIAAGPAGKVRFEEIIDVARSSSYGDTVSMLYVVEGAASRTAQPKKLEIVVRRGRQKKSGSAFWVIDYAGAAKDQPG